MVRGEPTVLPTRFPNLLVNGASGIAVGMATNMPTHNLGEVIDGCLAYIRNIEARIANPETEEITVSDLMEYIKAPDFPTGGTIYGYQGVRDAFETGRGRVIIRSNADIETDNNGREHIIITELPYGVVKSDLVSNIAALVDDKRIEGITDISDQSKRDIRIVIDIKRDANAQVVLNKLYKFTALQSSFAVNNIALVKGRPMLLNLKDLVRNFIEHRMDVVTRRTRFLLKKAQERAHILEGLIIAVDNIDEVVKIIRASRTPADAQTNLEARELKAEYAELEKEIAHLNDLLANESLRYELIAGELQELKDKYADERRTRIVKMATEFNPEDMYADDDMVITISHLGYIKRTPLADFRQQGRGGIGSKASNTRDEDFIEYVHTASMHSTMMFFTTLGRLYWIKVYELPEGNRQSKGRAMQNVISLQKDEKVCAFINVKGLNDPEYVKNHYLIFATRNGLMKKTTLEDYSRPRTNGIIALGLRDGDSLISVALTDGESQMLIASSNGKVVRFPENTVRPMGRTATGVRAIKLDEDGQDHAIGMICVDSNSEDTVLVISEKGFGKRTALDDENGEPIYRITNRGGKGVKTMALTDKTGSLVGLHAVQDDEDLMLITKSGTAIRMAMDSIRVQGRATQGVKLIELQKRNDVLMFGCVVPKEEDEQNGEAALNGENGEPSETPENVEQNNE